MELPIFNDSPPLAPSVGDRSAYQSASNEQEKNFADLIDRTPVTRHEPEPRRPDEPQPATESASEDASPETNESVLDDSDTQESDVTASADADRQTEESEDQPRNSNEGSEPVQTGKTVVQEQANSLNTAGDVANSITSAGQEMGVVADAESATTPDGETQQTGVNNDSTATGKLGVATDATPKGDIEQAASTQSPSPESAALATEQEDGLQSEAANRSHPKQDRSTSPKHEDQAFEAVPRSKASVASKGTDATLPGPEAPMEIQAASSHDASEHLANEAPEGRAGAERPSRAAAAADRTAEPGSPQGVARGETKTPLSNVDQTRLIQRVARAIHAAPERGGVIRIRLRPPELGSLHLEVRMENGGLTARMEAETAQARNVLMDNLSQLRDRLAEQGVRVDKFDIDIAQQDTGRSEQQARQAHDREHNAQNNAGQNQDEPDGTSEPTPEAAQVIGQRNLNVII